MPDNIDINTMNVVSSTTVYKEQKSGKSTPAPSIPGSALNSTAIPGSAKTETSVVSAIKQKSFVRVKAKDLERKEVALNMPAKFILLSSINGDIDLSIRKRAIAIAAKSARKRSSSDTYFRGRDTVPESLLAAMRVEAREKEYRFRSRKEMKFRSEADRYGVLYRAGRYEPSTKRMVGLSRVGGAGAGDGSATDAQQTDAEGGAASGIPTPTATKAVGKDSAAQEQQGTYRSPGYTVKTGTAQMIKPNFNHHTSIVPSRAMPWSAPVLSVTVVRISLSPPVQ